MQLSEAQTIADGAFAMLSPWCDRIEIAGSIRRKRPEVKDIELVCIPHQDEVPEGLFGTRPARSDGFVAAVRRLGYVSKGRPSTGKYCAITMPTIKLDLFMAHPDNWGFILAIRTGSAAFSHKVLGRGWRRAGCHAEDGMIYRNRDDLPILMREEEDLFKLIQVPWVPPERRELP
jgi:DNA polymerase/3'-5' exonuclease PolX